MSAKLIQFNKSQVEKLNMAPPTTLLGKLMNKAEIDPPPPVGNNFNPATIGNFNSNQSWDSIKSIADTVANMLVDVAIEINQTIRLLNAAGIENKEVTITVNGLKRDLASYTDKVALLKQKHEGRTGMVTSNDEYSECMNVGLEYMSLNEEIRAVFFQPLTTLTEYASTAKQRLAAQNPNVVTDVVAKEVA